MSERNEEQDPEGAIPLWQRLWRKKRGDVIQGSVGEGARNIVVGKNIVQIGTLIIPILPLLIGSLALLGMFALGIYRFALPLPPTPKVMNGIFNVAIADFGEVKDSSGVAQASEDGQLLANDFFERLENNLDKAGELSAYVKLQHDYIEFIPGESPQARLEAAAALASQINADVVIYGYLDRTRSQVKFVPEFYVSPSLTGAEESTGPDAFGSPVRVRLPLADNAVHRNELTKEVIPRFEALTEFMFGLAFFKTDEPDQALKHLELARAVPEWKDEQGKEILYLWIGSTLLRGALKDGKTGDFSCPVASSEQAGYWKCAKAAFETALKLNPKFARAYIGLGKLWFDQAEQTRDGLPVFDCTMYERAIDEYQRALDRAMEASATAYVDLKAYYNSGLAYASLYRNCGEQYRSSYSSAVENLKLAIAAYEKSTQVSLTREIGAKAYYQLGAVDNQGTDYEAAVTAFQQVISIANPDQISEEDWQSIRWNAYQQMGDAYSELAKAGGRTDWQKAIEAYQQVTANYEARENVDSMVASEAYFGAGVAYEALGDMVRARATYTQARDQGVPGSTIVALAEEKLQALGEP